MNEEEEPKHEDDLELYGDPRIASRNAKVPRWLILTYLILPIWGIISMWYFWNGSIGWFDRGYWHELQIAAKTTYPYKVEPEETK